MSMVQAELMLVLCWCACAFCGEMLWVLVNRQDIQASAVPAGERRLSAEYSYLSGDTVDVSCVTTVGACRVRLDYDYVEDRLVGYANTSDMWIKSRLTSGDGVGMRATLHVAHHRTSVHCACAGAGAIAPILTVTFVLQTASDKLVNLTMNGLSLRPEIRDITLVYTVHYLKGERFTFRLTHNTDASELLVNMTTEQRPYSISTSIEIEVMPNSSYYDNRKPLMYAAFNNYTNEQIFVVQVYFKPLNDGLIDASQLTLDVPQSNVILKMYEWRGDQRIYYQFADGDVLSLKCNTSADLHYMTNHVLIFGDSAPTNKTSIPMRVKLSSADDRAELVCALSSTTRYRNKTKQIRIILCRKNITTDGRGGGVPAAALGGGIVGALAGVVLLVALVLCCVRKRSHRFRCITGDVGLFGRDASIPRHLTAQREPHDETPADQVAGEHTYGAAPPRIVPRATEEDGISPELNYAVLDIRPSNKASERVECEESPYAEVCLHDSACLRPDDRPS